MNAISTNSNVSSASSKAPSNQPNATTASAPQASAGDRVEISAAGRNLSSVETLSAHLEGMLSGQQPGNNAISVKKAESKDWTTGLLNQSVFDSKFYAEHNPDLAKNGVSNDEQLKQHWLTHGYHEGRQASSSFNPAQYLQGYSDLQKAGLKTSEDALQHWLTFGQNEGRQGVSDISNRPEIYSNAKTFDAKFYAALNPDLAKNGVTSEAELKAHWLQNGIQEGRQASASFDAAWYLKQYPDLGQNGIKTTADAIRHYNDFGMAEGRQTSALKADVPYGTSGLKLDIYQPAGTGDKKVPVVIDLVGNAFHRPDKSQPLEQKTGQEFAQNGIALVTPDYHGAPESHYPTALNDVTDVLKFVKEHASEYNWDLNNITLKGGSAGGNLALQHTLNPEFDSNPDLPRIKNVIAVAPATDLSVDLSKDKFSQNDSLTNLVPDYLGSNDANLKAQASPITYAGLPSDKHFYVAFAQDDWLTTADDQAKPFIAKMQAAGQNVTVEEKQVGGHGEWLAPSSNDYDPQFNHRLAQWILNQG